MGDASRQSSHCVDGAFEGNPFGWQATHLVACTHLRADQKASGDEIEAHAGDRRRSRPTRIRPQSLLDTRYHDAAHEETLCDEEGHHRHDQQDQKGQQPGRMLCRVGPLDLGDESIHVAAGLSTPTSNQPTVALTFGRDTEGRPTSVITPWGTTTYCSLWREPDLGSEGRGFKYPGRASTPNQARTERTAIARVRRGLVVVDKQAGFSTTDRPVRDAWAPQRGPPVQPKLPQRRQPRPALSSRRRAARTSRQPLAPCGRV